MPEKKIEPRRPILTRKEQTLLAFLLALLVVGGIVRKLRMDWQHAEPRARAQVLNLKHGQN